MEKELICKVARLRILTPGRRAGNTKSGEDKRLQKDTATRTKRQNDPRNERVSFFVKGPPNLSYPREIFSG